MNKLIMMCGLPGSGKSTIANEYKKEYAADGVEVEIFSSDDIREELYGDANIQGDSKEVFDTLNRRLLHYLDVDCGRVAIYDATNLSAKGRKSLVNTVKHLHSVCYFECVFVACRLSECKRRQFSRDRQVPAEVIDRMVRKFQTPWYNEGWDRIKVVQGGYLYDLTAEHIDAWSIEHDNPHHELSIGKHMAAARDEMRAMTRDWVGTEKAIDVITTAAYHHDIGKPHTKSFTNMKGEATYDAHYYSHDNVSSYMWLSSSEAFDRTVESTLVIAALIQYHMMPYFLAPKGQTATKEELLAWCSKHGFTEQFAEQLWVVHQADQGAH